MATLAGNSIASSYTSLLKLNGNTDSTAAGNGSNAIQVKTGDDDATPLFLNTDRVGIGIQPATALDVSGGLNSAHSTFSGQAGRGLLIETQATTNNDDTVVLNAQTSTGEIAFELNSSEKMRLDSTGLGIGATTIQQLLHLEKDDADVGIALTQTGQRSWSFGIDNSDSDRLKIGYSTTIGTNTVATFTESGQLGIGTTPESVLHINTSSSGGIGGKLIIDNQASTADGNGTEISFFNGSGASASGVANSRIRSVSTGNTNGYSELQFYGYNTGGEALRMVIAKDGSVGIGTSSPSSFDSEANDLVVGDGSGDSGITIYNGQNAGDFGSIFFADGTSGTALKAGFIRYEQNTSAMTFGMNAVEKVKIDINGNVGIGISDPDAYLAGANNLVLGGTSGNHGLTIRSASDSAGMIAFGDGDASTDAGYRGQIKYLHSSDKMLFITSSQNRIAIDSNGTGIGTTSPDALLDLTSSTGYANLRLGQNKTNESAQRAGISAQPYLKAEEPTAGMFMFIDGTGSTQDTADLQLGGGHGSFNAVKQIKFYTASDAVTTSGTEVMRLDANSRISLSNNDAGSGNTVFGYLAGQSIDAGSNNNVFIGERVADASLNDALNNIGLGYFALSSLINGDNNVVIGSSAGLNITGTSATVLIGKEAGNSINNASAVGSIGIGQHAIKDVTNGSGNTAMGYTAGKNLTDGGNNTIVGFQAMSAGGTSPSQCTAVGMNSLLNVTGSNNTAVGYNAGDVTEAATLSTFIGYSADGSGANINNETVIGANATGQGGNSVTLGNADVTDVYMAQDSGATVHCAGVNFPDSQVASADANTLDDYEEGTYTPVVSNGSSNYSASVENGYYTKIGDQVFVQVNITSSEAGSGGVLQVTLPFNYNGAGNKFITASVRYGGLDLDANCVQLMLGNSSSGTSNLLFFSQQRDDNTQLNLSADAYSSGDTFQFNVHYKVA